MKKLNKRTQILLGILVVLIIYYLIDSGIFSAKDIVEQAQTLVESTKKSDELGEDDVSKYIHMASLTGLNWDGGWEKDPFFYVSPETLKGSSKGGLIDQLFGSSGGTETTGFELTGISWHGNSGFALINGSVVKEGDVISGFKLEKIAVNYVVLKQGVQTIRLSLNE